MGKKGKKIPSCLTLSALPSKTDICANSVDLDDRIYTFCHSVFDFRLKSLFSSMDFFKLWDRRVHFRNLGERVKTLSKALSNNLTYHENCHHIIAISIYVMLELFNPGQI